MTMFPLKSDIFVWAELYLLSRRIGEIGAKRVLWGIVWFIDTPCSDFQDQSGRANGRADGPGRASGPCDLILTTRADRPGQATGPGDLISTLTRGGRLPRRPESPDRGRPVSPVAGGGPRSRAADLWRPRRRPSTT